MAATAAGTLETVPFARILYKLLSAGTAGVLDIQRDGEAFTIGLLNGGVAALRAEHEDGRFGAFLVQGGHITGAQLEAALQTLAAQGPNSVPLGAILAGQGVLAADAVPGLLQAFVRARITGMFGWQAGQFSFTPKAVTPPPWPGPENQVALLWSGIKQGCALGMLQAFAAGYAEKPVSIKEQRAIAQFRDVIGATGRSFVNAIDGHRTVSQILDLVAPATVGERNREMALRVLFLLAIIDGIAFVRAASPRITASIPQVAAADAVPALRVRRDYMKSSEPHVVLGLEPGATKAEATDAYFRLLKEYHPSLIGQEGSEEDRLKMEIYMLIEQAYRTVLAQAGS